MSEMRNRWFRWNLFTGIVLFSASCVFAGEKIESESDRQWNVAVASVDVRLYADHLVAINHRGEGVEVDIDQFRSGGWVGVATFHLSRSGLKVGDDILSHNSAQMLQNRLGAGDELRITVRPALGRAFHAAGRALREAAGKETEPSEPLGKVLVTLE